jgi:DNA-binding response OmpR family regulator
MKVNGNGNNLAHKRVLIVDDEDNMRHMLKVMLSKTGYQVSEAANGTEALENMAEDHFDFILCDIRMPEMDGMQFLKAAQDKFPEKTIIMMSAYGTVETALEAMKMGAYDYISKPFNPRELLARIRAVLRRCHEVPVVSTVSADTYQFGPFSLNIKSHVLTCSDEEISLTHREFTLLRIFLENQNKVLNRDTLLKLSKGYERSPMDRSIDVCVGRLRRKIEQDPAKPVYLRTVWGAGYIFSME